MRKLVTIQEVLDVDKVENSDNLEVIKVLGWKIVSRKGTFKKGDKCVYFEIDSLLPEKPMFEFLRANSWKENLKMFRLKTVKLRGQISQGLTIPLSEFISEIPNINELEIGYDLTSELGVVKYEPELSNGSEGQEKHYNWEIEKTDEERVQSNTSYIDFIKGLPYYISLKLDGTSSTFIVSIENDKPIVNVCGRNICFDRKTKHEYADGSTKIVDTKNKYFDIEEKYDIGNKLIDYYNKYGVRLALQGEVIGQSIQSNKMNIEGKDLYIFNVLSKKDNENEFKFMNVNDAISLIESFGMKFVPIIDMGDEFNYNTVEELLELAKGKYCQYPEFVNANKDQHQEGIVIRSLDSSISFKVINNDFLMTNGE